MDVGPVPPDYLLSSEAPEEDGGTSGHVTRGAARLYAPSESLVDHQSFYMQTDNFRSHSAGSGDNRMTNHTSGNGTTAITTNGLPQTAAATSPAVLNPTSSTVCMVCGKVGKPKFNVQRKSGETLRLCSEACLTAFRKKPSSYLKSSKEQNTGAGSGPASVAEPSSVGPPATTAPTSVAVSMPPGTLTGPCGQCSKDCAFLAGSTTLIWQSALFCNDRCLEAFQTTNLPGACGQCARLVEDRLTGRYSLVYQGTHRQFCSLNCMDEFRLHNSACAHCARDVIIMESLSEQFKSQSLAGGSRADVKMFCSTECYEAFNSAEEAKRVKTDGSANYRTRMSTGHVACVSCRKVGQPKLELEDPDSGGKYRFCTEECFYNYVTERPSLRAYRCCGNCGLVAKKLATASLLAGGKAHYFCSRPCLLAFRSTNSTLIRCEWCADDDCPNLSMIEQLDRDGSIKLLCTISCLRLRESVRCDCCGRFGKATYQLTVAGLDPPTKSFCSYGCIETFQGNVAARAAGEAIGAEVEVESGGISAGISRRRSAGTATGSKSRPKTAKEYLEASGVAASSVEQQVVKQHFNQVNVQLSDEIRTAQSSSLSLGVARSNKSIQTRPATIARATTCKPEALEFEAQTEEDWARKNYIVPIPTPIYIPTPIAAVEKPTAFPCPIPIPVPIPVFIPVPVKTADKILRRIETINKHLKGNPLEVDVLAMAHAIRESIGIAEATESAEFVNQYVEEEGIATQTDPVDCFEPGTAILIEEAQRLAQEQLAAATASAGQVMMADVAPSATDPAMGVDSRLRIGDEVLQLAFMATGNGGEGISSADIDSIEAAKRMRLSGDGTQYVYAGSENQMDTSVAQPIVPTYETVQIPEEKYSLKYLYGLTAWTNWVTRRNTNLETQAAKRGIRPAGTSLFTSPLPANVLVLSNDDLNAALSVFVREARRASGEEYDPDSVYYLCLGLQIYLAENGRVENVFFDRQFSEFQKALNTITAKYQPQLSPANELVCRIEEEHLWEAKQLGPYSPGCLLNTLLYLNTKHFLLATPEQHSRLAFQNITQQRRKDEMGNLVKYLRYVRPGVFGGTVPRGGPQPALEQVQNLQDTMRDPLFIFEFYLSKCPEAARTRPDSLYYLTPDPNCQPNSQTWFMPLPMGVDKLAALLTRIQMVREIQEALFVAGILRVEHFTPTTVPDDASANTG